MTRFSEKQARMMGILDDMKPKRKRTPKKNEAILNARKIEDGVLLIIPENMPSLNVWKNWHWAKQATYKKDLTKLMADLSLIVGCPQYERATVEITHYFRTNRNRDSGDNYAPKFVMDALRYAGFIIEDHSGVVRVPEPTLLVDRESWRTEIKITKVKGEL